jgi:hypothetical protein
MLRVAFWNDVDEIEEPAHFQEKNIFTIFFNESGDHKIAVLPKRQQLPRTYFIECVLQPLAESCDREGRKAHEKRVMVDFNEALIHNAEGVQEALARLRFKRVEHPPDSPD